jgi:hypothetical protein
MQLKQFEIGVNVTIILEGRVAGDMLPDAAG